MPQSPILGDQVQIEPGTTTYGTRVIDRDTTDGGLRFADPNVTVSLKDLVGTRNITDLYVVGQGDGSGYAAIQDAVDAAPSNATADAPVVIAIHNGLYQENLTIEKDGLHLVGMGGVTIRNSGANPTVTVQEGATVPLRTVLQGLRIENTEDAENCVFADGSETYASGTVTVVNAPLAAADTLTIGGTALTGVTGTRVSGSDNFSVDGVTTSAIATEIAAAINDVANSFDTTVSALAIGAVITITAVASGAGGNAITLASSTTPAGGLTLSGANLTGGGDPPTLLTDGLHIIECDLVASGVGTRQVEAATVNRVFVRGGTWWGSSSTSECVVTNTGYFRVSGVEWVNDFQLSYNTGSTEPSAGAGEYELSHCATSGDVLVNLTGDGAMKMLGLPNGGTFTQGGDQAVSINQCVITTLQLDDTTTGTFLNSRRTTATSTGTPTLSESQFTGSVVFAASATETVTFDIPQPDAVYAVMVDSPTLGSIPQVTARGTDDFTLTAAGAFSGTVFYTVIRQA